MMAWYKQLSVHTRLFGILAIMVLMGTVLTIWNIMNIIRINSAANEMFRVDVELENLQNAQMYFLMMEASEEDFLLTGSSHYIDIHESNRALARMYMHGALADADTAEEKTALQGLRNDLEEYESTFLEVSNTYANDPQKAIQMSLELSNREIQDAHEQAESMVAGENEKLNAISAKVEQDTRISLIVSAVGLVSFFILAFLAAQSTLFGLILPLDTLNEAAFQAGSADFNASKVEKLAKGKSGITRLARSILDMDAASRKREQNLVERIDALRARLAEHRGGHAK